MNFIKFVRSVWELPQQVVGSIVRKAYRGKFMFEYNGVKVYGWNRAGGISLGNTIMMPYTDKTMEDPWVDRYVRHEYGHCMQSKYLGWLYLLVIGLPSITWAGLFDKYREKNGISYYSFYTERWADKLGGIPPR